MALIVGVDIIEIPRVERVYARYGERFLRRVYTEREIAYCRGRAPQLASRFAAKEATMKALGTGVRGVRWRDVEVVRGRGQAPRIVLHGTARARADRLGMTDIALSLSHSKEFAVASVVGDSERGNILVRGDNMMDAQTKAVYEEIIKVAQNEDVITYSKLGSRTGNTSMGVVPILDSINRIEHREGRPLLSAAVVSKSRNMPGRGFFNLAADLGVKSGDEDNFKFWLKEIRRVHDYWRKRRAVRIHPEIQAFARV